MAEQVKNGVPVAEDNVVATENMIPPVIQKMYDRRPYVTVPDAPAVHARLCEAGKNAYALNFNGVDIITMRMPEGRKPGRLRAHSDGDFQSEPMTQQFAVWTVDEDVEVEVELSSPVEMWNMRPRRAKSGEAILGQVGYPLMYGVNGMYIPDWDLLFHWYGSDFKWEAKTVTRDDKGFHAHMKVRWGNRPWIVVLQPHYYGEHLGYHYHKPWKFRPNPKPITGWCSWEAFHDDVKQEDLEEAGKFLQVLKAYGLEYMQLDDGYQQRLVPMANDGSCADSWLHLNEKFPDGHQGILNAMKGNGFKPGIWTNATITNPVAVKTQKDLCIKDKNGDDICGDWILYPMRCTPENLKKHVIPCYKAFREMGYEYVKSDSLRHLIFDGSEEAVRLGTMTIDEARANQRAYMEAARESLGKDIYYLSCWGVLTQSIGVCDAMRVGTDSSPSWSSYSMQLRELARWFSAQRVMFTVDPDMVCVRGELKRARMMLSLAALSGSLFMISDKVDQYDDDRLTLIKRTMPALTTRAAETGPVDYSTPACVFMRGIDEDISSRLISHIDDEKAPFSSLWSTHFAQGGRCWTVVQRIAVIPMAAVSIKMSDVGLDPERIYYAYSYWEDTGFFIRNGEIPFSALELGDTTVLALTDITDGIPALLGSDRHVSMDAVSVTDVQASPNKLTLALKGFDGLHVRYTLFTRGLMGEIAASGAEAKVYTEGDISKLDVVFSGETAHMTIE